MSASLMAVSLTSSNLYQHGWPRRVWLPSIISSMIKNVDCNWKINRENQSLGLFIRNWNVVINHSRWPEMLNFACVVDQRRRGHNYMQTNIWIFSMKIGCLEADNYYLIAVINIKHLVNWPFGHFSVSQWKWSNYRQQWPTKPWPTAIMLSSTR